MTITIGEIIKGHLIHLLPVFHLADQEKSILYLYYMLTKESLSLPINAPIPKFSTINHDGMPIEISLSVGENQPGNLRILTEIGVPGASLPTRINQTCMRLNEILDYLDMKDAGSEVTLAFKTLLPRDPSALTGWRGGIWIGAGFSPDGRTGIKLYVNAADGPVTERWKKMGLLLKELGWTHTFGALLRISSAIPEYAIPLGIAIDLTPKGIGKVKFYFRSFNYSPAFIESVLTSANLSYHIGHFFRFVDRICLENPSFPPSSVIVSAEFSNGNTGDMDIKIDICAHCLFSSDQRAQSAVYGILKDSDLNRSRYNAVLDELSYNSLSAFKLNHHAFLGMGYSHKKGSRLNIYLKPSIEVYQQEMTQTCVERADKKRAPHLLSIQDMLSQSVKHHTLLDKVEGSIRSATAYIVSHQSPHGQWLDFSLPTGPSDAWVTGYTGLSLTTLPKEFRDPGIETAIQRVIPWCWAAMNSDYGWGYNSTTGSDADSTANIISFLSSYHVPIPCACYQKLISFRKDDGGFATFHTENAGDSWGDCHPDVTPVALDAFLTGNMKKDPVFIQGKKYLKKNQEPRGIWQSYWWDSYLYSTWVNLVFLERMGWDYRRNDCWNFLIKQTIPSDPFKLALYAGCLFQLSGYYQNSSSLIASAVHNLTKMQLKDGSWTGFPKLRLTNNHIKKPWSRQNSGPLFMDHQRLFTTATAIRVLSPFCSHLTNRENVSQTVSTGSSF